MYKELKKEIVNWLLDNENQWQRVNNCTDKFKAYIFDADGNYLIGGKDVLDFIYKANNILYHHTECELKKII